MPIVVVHRSDGSGTSYIFTDFLSHVSPEWKSKVGTGKSVSWPAPSSVGAKGNEGVAGQIRSTPGAIGYVELAYVIENHMPAATLQNKRRQVGGLHARDRRRGRGEQAEGERDELLDRRRDGRELVSDLGLLVGRRLQEAVATRRAPRRSTTCCRGWSDPQGQSNAKSVDYVPLPRQRAERGAATLRQMQH